MTKIAAVFFAALVSIAPICRAQTPAPDSAKRAAMARDSVKMARLFAISEYPLLKGSKWSGVIPVADPTEVPDPSREYKLLFEMTAKNPDSLTGEINQCLGEVARILNLHVASGIPASRIHPVVVIHGPGIEALTTSESYRKKHSVDNPNLQIVRDLGAAGTRFIACGQAMAFFEFTREDLLPDVKVSLTAQTVLSNYQLQGYVLYSIEPDK
jgi:intracellular sulfur oxidation DsrE/DsrF family protein